MLRAIIRGYFSFGFGFMASIPLSMFFKVSDKLSPDGVVAGFFSFLFAVGFGLLTTKRKPIFILIYTWGIITGSNFTRGS